MTAAAPLDLTITPRNMVFGRDEAPGRWWYGGNPAATAFYNVLSLTFPKGEAFFIESVKHYRDKTTEPLTSQVAAFIKQEAIHSREHSHFNKQVREAGYDLTLIEERFNANLAETKAINMPIVNLTATLAFEHFTGILAHAWLANDRYFKGSPQDVSRLWRWHSIEEIEHKSVAYDTFNAVMKDVPAHKRYLLRSNIMLRVTRLFLINRLRDMKELFKQDGIDTPKTWLRVANYLLVYPGLFRQIFPSWLAYFRPGFHPWDHDDRALIKAAAEKLGAEGTLDMGAAA
jgi:predicted metal-dependent hydrolase